MLAYTLRMAPSTTFLDALRPAIRTLPAYNSGLSAEYVRARYHVSEVAKLGKPRCSLIADSCAVQRE